MKILFDFLPIALFFGMFKYAENHKEWAAAWTTEWFGFMVAGGVVDAVQAPVLLSTIVVIVASLAQVGCLVLMRRKVDRMLIVSLVLVTLLGGATIYLHNENFIKLKPTLLYWVMAAALLVGQLVFKKNGIQALLGAQMTLPAPVWRYVNLSWVGFFTAMGLLNLWVAYYFSTSTWVNFKLFGGLGLMLLFVLAQALYLSKYTKSEAP